MMQGGREKHIEVPTPMFFVSVASKGLNVCVSGLESTLAGTSISVDFKGFRLYENCAKAKWRKGTPSVAVKRMRK